MSTRGSTVFLYVAGLVFGLTGLAFLLQPAWVPAIRELTNPSADALNDARAIYGGLEAGLGVFFLACAPRARLHEAGLLAAAAVGGVAAMSRFVAFAMVAGTPPAHLAYGALDGIGALVAVWMLRNWSR